MIQSNETITAPATPSGVSALAVIRVSGADAFTICNNCLSKNLNNEKANTLHYCKFIDNGQMIDEVVCGIFRAPNSYTGEDLIEISCHGSPFIVSKILQTLTKNGARMAEAGEFTLRSFMNGKMDLTQAEAVADMIHSHSEASLKMAVQQIRGGFKKDIAELRQELVDFAALLELENDFGEEDVEFANRDQLQKQIEDLMIKIDTYQGSFAAGNVIKNGINTVIAGKPNAGKSTLLNALLNEERAIVSDIEGTTRDSIEEMFYLKGIAFRLIDTAGLRDSSDVIEKMGVDRAKEYISKSSLLIYLFDVNHTTSDDLQSQLSNIPDTQYRLIVGNKADETKIDKSQWPKNTLFISAKNGEIQSLIEALEHIAANYEFGNETIINNTRHSDALLKCNESLRRVLDGIQQQATSDWLALDLRDALYYLGLITGEVTNDEILGSVFSRFCIGK
jgi:tRNA modification GTPase